MHFFPTASIFLTFSLLLLALNHYLKKPMHANIFIVIGSLVFCLCYRYVLHATVQINDSETFSTIISGISFPDVLINGILSYLLFAGALHCDLHTIKKLKFTIMPLALIGTIMSTFIVGYSIFMTLHLIGYKHNLITCLIFGSLISPTDPIAVLSMLKELGAAKFLKETIAGESLFNDGVGIVLFITLIGLANHETSNINSILYLFLRLSVGGLLYGYILGKIGFWVISTVEQDLEFTFILTLWITTTGYALAQYLDISGPLAMVMAGLIIGSRLDNWRTRQYLLAFWDTIDNSLNCFLFLLIGLEMLVFQIPYKLTYLFLIVILITTAARAFTVYLSLYMFKKHNKKTLPLWPVISWGGLRGGLSIALVLSIPNSIDHEIFIFFTYSIVLFSIIVQGLTIKPLLEKINTLIEVDRLTGKI